MSALDSIVAKLLQESKEKDLNDEELDQYVTEMILKEAKTKQINYEKYGINGLTKRSLPSLNKTFLLNMVKNSDTHNEELLFRERRKANEKLEELENPKEKRIEKSYVVDKRRMSYDDKNNDIQRSSKEQYSSSDSSEPRRKKGRGEFGITRMDQESMDNQFETIIDDNQNNIQEKDQIKKKKKNKQKGKKKEGKEKKKKKNGKSKKSSSNDQDKGKVEKSQPILEKQNLPAVCFW